MPSRPVPIRLPAALAHVVKKTDLDQNALVSYQTDAILRILARACDDVAKDPSKFRTPDLTAIDNQMTAFLRRALEIGFRSAREKARAQGHKMRVKMAVLPKGAIPNLKSLSALFANKKAWDAIQRRNKILADRLKRAYLDKLERRFKRVMPKVLAGEITPEEAKAQLKKAVGSTKSRAETIFRTESTKYFVDAQVSFFDGDSDIVGFLFHSITDSGRTDICRSRHGMVMKPGSPELKENKPPLHFNCRSHLIALADTPANLKMVNDPARDPDKRTLAPLPPGWQK